MKNKPNKVKKKREIKISVADIITIVLIFTIWVLLFILLCKIFEEPQFKITKEECENKTISVIGNDYGGTGNWIYYFNPPVNTTHCFMFEVKREITKDLPDFCYNLGKTYEEMIECNLIYNKNLDVEWLNENCKISAEDMIFDEDCIEGQPCGFDNLKYKCGEYLVKVLK